MKILLLIIVFGAIFVAMTVTIMMAGASSGNRTPLPDEDAGEEIDEKDKKLFQLSIVHINDFHARFEETNDRSLACLQGQTCIAGFARMKTVVDSLMAKRENSILLNAGDNFQGTFWYNLLRYNVTAHFLNLLPTDATTLGNHEFAHRVEGLVPFLKMSDMSQK
jgi:5'-nucleotidase